MGHSGYKINGVPNILMGNKHTWGILTAGLCCTIPDVPGGGGGGHSRYILVGVCRSTSKKGGLRHGHNPKKGGLRHGYNPKKGDLRHGHEWKKGVLGTGTSRKRGKKDNLSN